MNRPRAGKFYETRTRDISTLAHNEKSRCDRSCVVRGKDQFVRHMRKCGWKCGIVPWKRLLLKCPFRTSWIARIRVCPHDGQTPLSAHCPLFDLATRREGDVSRHSKSKKTRWSAVNSTVNSTRSIDSANVGTVWALDIHKNVGAGFITNVGHVGSLGA